MSKIPTLNALKNLDRWQHFCAWLEEQPSNASYTVPERFWWLTATAEHFSHGDKEGRQRGRDAAVVRKAYRLIFWSTGHGWRLHTGWQERIELLRSQAIQVEVVDQPSLLTEEPHA